MCSRSRSTQKTARKYAEPTVLWSKPTCGLAGFAGGKPGAQNLADSKIVTDALRVHAAKHGKIAAICASPALVLAPLGILDGREATCYPGMEPESDKILMRGAPVVALDNLITANGPASTLAFALAIVRNSCGDAVAQQIGEGMLVYAKTSNFYF